MANPLLEIMPAGPAMTPRNALLYPESQQGEVTPSDAFESHRQNILDAWKAVHDPQTWGGAPADGGSTTDMLRAYLDPRTGQPTELAERYMTLPGAFVGSSGGPSLGEQAGLRISTRVPYDVAAKKAPETVHGTADNTVGLESSKASDAAYAKNAQLLRDYPGVKVDPAASDDDVVNGFIGHIKDNLLWLYDKLDPAMRNRARLWYEGANRIANQWADEYGMEPHQAAGTLAALSPQKDWFQNVSLAKRLLDIRANQADTVMTPEMEAWAKGYIDRLAKKTPDAAAELRGQVNAMRGRTFGQLNDPDSRAVWARIYDEAHNDRSYPIVSPEGDIGELATTAAGEPQKVGWGSFAEISKALQAADAPDTTTISQLMGGKHKVRNFYNNIVAPNAQNGDVTIDTHAIAAGLLRPLAGTNREVSHGLGLGKGAADSSATGSRGLYGLYADAYRQAAAERGILPREMQSITWEGVRGLFSPVQKRNKVFVADADKIWDAYRNGHITADEARDAIHAHAGGIGEPDWGVSDLAPDD